MLSAQNPHFFSFSCQEDSCYLSSVNQNRALRACLLKCANEIPKELPLKEQILMSILLNRYKSPPRICLLCGHSRSIIEWSCRCGGCLHLRGILLVDKGCSSFVYNLQEIGWIPWVNERNRSNSAHPNVEANMRSLP